MTRFYTILMRPVTVSLEVNCGKVAHNIFICDGLSKTKKKSELIRPLIYLIINHRFILFVTFRKESPIMLCFNFYFIFLDFFALVPPTITFKSKAKVTIVEGNVLYLFCEAEGNPKPLVTWRKSGNVLQSNISKTELIIHDASENDAGIYECEVSNSVGTLTYTVEVIIKGNVT